MDFEEFIMRFLLILVCFASPALLLSGECSLIKVLMYEMFEIDFNIWDIFRILDDLIEI